VLELLFHLVLTTRDINAMCSVHSRLHQEDQVVMVVVVLGQVQENKFKSKFQTTRFGHESKLMHAL
jgi:hypothetical protein